jgi:hypothetical protein
LCGALAAAEGGEWGRYGGFHKWRYPPYYKWRMKWGTPILGNLHVYKTGSDKPTIMPMCKVIFGKYDEAYKTL